MIMLWKVTVGDVFIRFIYLEQFICAHEWNNVQLTWRHIQTPDNAHSGVSKWVESTNPQKNLINIKNKIKSMHVPNTVMHMSSSQSMPEL